MSGSRPTLLAPLTRMCSCTMHLHLPQPREISPPFLSPSFKLKPTFQPTAKLLAEYKLRNYLQ
jgi:hypothetical protein